MSVIISNENNIVSVFQRENGEMVLKGVASSLSQFHTILNIVDPFDGIIIQPHSEFSGETLKYMTEKFYANNGVSVYVVNDTTIF